MRDGDLRFEDARSGFGLEFRYGENIRGTSVGAWNWQEAACLGNFKVEMRKRPRATDTSKRTKGKSEVRKVQMIVGPVHQAEESC